MSNSRKSAGGGGKATGLMQNTNSTNSGGTSSTHASHQHHKNLRRHLDMGLPNYGGDNSTGSGNNQTNLFEIKKRSIDFFQ